MTDSTRIIAAGLASGVLGWALENVIVGPRESRYAFSLPFMPVYAVGGAIVAAAKPALDNVGLVKQVAAYSAILGGVELVAGTADRALGGREWGYGSQGNVVDVPHALTWGVLGTALAAVMP